MGKTLLLKIHVSIKSYGYRTKEEAKDFKGVEILFLIPFYFMLKN